MKCSFLIRSCVMPNHPSAWRDFKAIEQLVYSSKSGASGCQPRRNSSKNPRTLLSCVTCPRNRGAYHEPGRSPRASVMIL